MLFKPTSSTKLTSLGAMRTTLPYLACNSRQSLCQVPRRYLWFLHDWLNLATNGPGILCKGWQKTLYSVSRARYVVTNRSKLLIVRYAPATLFDDEPTWPMACRVMKEELFEIILVDSWRKLCCWESCTLWQAMCTKQPRMLAMK